MLKDDFSNLFKFDLCTSNIKSTLTLRGFCKYHDTTLFEGIENTNTTQYNQVCFAMKYLIFHVKVCNRIELYTAVEEFAYVHYNHVRPHSYNNYKTPY